MTLVSCNSDGTPTSRPIDMHQQSYAEQLINLTPTIADKFSKRAKWFIKGLKKPKDFEEVACLTEGKSGFTLFAAAGMLHRYSLEHAVGEDLINIAADSLSEATRDLFDEAVPILREELAALGTMILNPDLFHCRCVRLTFRVSGCRELFYVIVGLTVKDVLPKLFLAGRLSHELYRPYDEEREKQINGVDREDDDSGVPRGEEPTPEGR